MPCAGDDIHVAIPQPFRRVADRAHTAFIKGGRVELADDFSGERDPDFLTNPRCPRHQLIHHPVELIQQMRPHIDGKNHLAGDDVAGVGVDVDMADGPHGVRLVLHRDLMHQFGDQRQTAPRVLAHMHGGGACVAFLARHRAFDPAQPLPVGDDADLLALGLQNRALFDVQLEEGVHLARAHLFLTLPADPFEFIPEPLALGVHPVQRPVERVLARKYARGEHSGGVTRAFLVRPVGDDNRMLCLDIQIIQRADDLQAPQHAQDTIIFPTRRLGIKVAAHIDRQCIRVRAFAPGEHVADLVDTHGAAGLFTPLLEQVAAFAVFIRQGLAVVPARDAGADLGHLHQAVPKPFAVDTQIFTGGWHGALLHLGRDLGLTNWSKQR